MEVDKRWAGSIGNQALSGQRTLFGLHMAGAGNRRWQMVHWNGTIARLIAGYKEEYARSAWVWRKSSQRLRGWVRKRGMEREEGKHSTRIYYVQQPS